MGPRPVPIFSMEVNIYFLFFKLPNCPKTTVYNQWPPFSNERKNIYKYYRKLDHSLTLNFSEKENYSNCFEKDNNKLKAE